MKGDKCYKYSTVARYVAVKRLPPILNVVEVGACIGDVIPNLFKFFPEARIDAYEGIENHALRAEAFIGKMESEGKIHKGQVRIYNEAVTNENGRHVVHLCPRNQRCSVIIRSGLEPSHPALPGEVFAALVQEVKTVSLGTVVDRLDGVDFFKIDCEGCERAVLGEGSAKALSRIRFISGEYHGLKMFWEATRATLWKTHQVQVMGNRIEGSFFAARIGPEVGILLDSVQPHPEVLGLRSHPFCLDCVREGDEAWHGLPPRNQYDTWARNTLVKTLTVEV